jgi:hypothetical protein
MLADRAGAMLYREGGHRFNRCSIIGFHGTSLKPMPSSRMAKRPLASISLRW